MSKYEAERLLFGDCQVSLANVRRGEELRRRVLGEETPKPAAESRPASSNWKAFLGKRK